MEDEKILLHDWLGDDDCSLKLITIDNNLILMLYARNFWCYVTLWTILSTWEEEIYMRVPNDMLFNSEYFINKYDLWVCVENSDLFDEEYPIYEVNLDILSKYDHKWVDKYFWKNQ